jgi:hypothetical protein
MSVAVVEELNPEHAPGPLVRPGAIQLLLDLETSGALTARELSLPVDIEYDRYESLGAFLGEFKSRVNFYLGDWLIFGEGVFAERWSQACEGTGLSEQTLLRIMAVCRGVAPGRRRDRLSFSVHAAVATLPAREQRSWLGRAEDHGWGYAELRNAMKAARRDEKPPLFDDEAPDAVLVDRVVEVARLIVSHAEIAGDNVIIRRDDYAQLVAALGLEV